MPAGPLAWEGDGNNTWERDGRRANQSGQIPLAGSDGDLLQAIVRPPVKGELRLQGIKEMTREAESRLHGDEAESEIGSSAGREEEEPRVSSSRADSPAPASDASFRSSGASYSSSSLVSDVESDGGDGGFPRTQCEYEEIPSFRWIATPLRWWKTNTRIQRHEVRASDFGPRASFWMNFPKAGSQLTPPHRAEDFKWKDYCPLGLRYTLGKITSLQRREVRASDFGPRASFWMNFPKAGSQLTPPHCAEDFKWKDYCPMVFRNLREMFKIDAADYMISICGSAALKELSSPGESGSVFFLSQDDRFMIKTLRKSEVQVLLRMLPNYYDHVRKYENTLITKFFGLHCVKPSSGQKFRFVVMGNMFCTELRIHRRYDLKGSSLGRSIDKVEIDENTTLKDLDLDYCFYLEPSWRDALLEQIKIDSKFLETLHIMDYSLLLGVHYRAPQNLQSQARSRRTTRADGLTILFDDAQDDDISNYPQGLVSVPRGNEENSIIVGPHIRGSWLRASAAGDEEVDLLLPGTARLQIQLGVNMPARAEHCAEQTPAEDESQFHQVYDVVLYLGIIDILQEYNMSKKIEHAYKSLQFDSLSISAVDPMLYSTRFMGFIQKVFPEMKISDS